LGLWAFIRISGFGFLVLPHGHIIIAISRNTLMGQATDTIGPEVAEFISRQAMFFVGTAPLSGEGRVNVSPKGLDTFRVLSPNRVCYLDLTGSGNETAAHLMENGRVTFMFCAFEGRAKILRLYGRGRAVLPGESEWEELLARFTEWPGVRQIIVAEVDRVQTSCGFAVPMMQLVGQRDELPQWAQKKGAAGLVEYREKKNRQSIDGLPAPR
jgi:hypothetical protein